MAYEINTASNLQDLFDKIITFLTTDPTLVAAGQNWQVLRQRIDNVASHTCSVTSVANDLQYTNNYEPRTFNTDSEGSAAAYFYANSGLTLGTSNSKWQLKVAKEIKTVRLRAAYHASYTQYMLRNFRLQYSDNDIDWFTALTVASATEFSIGEEKDYAVPGSPGAHLYWRIIFDTVQVGTTAIAWHYMLLLEADGTVANHYGSEAILKATGLAGTEEIFVGLRTRYNIAGGWHNLFVNGYTGYAANEQSWHKQPGALPGIGETYMAQVPAIPCWDTTMPYWFVADGRCFKFAVKVATSYEGGYLGFFLPYATPGQYPYPLMVGGSLVCGSTPAEYRYSDASIRHGVFPGPGINNYAATEGRYATVYIRDTDGSWLYFGNRGDSSPQPDDIYGMTTLSSAPYTPQNALRAFWPHCQNDQWGVGLRPYRECLGGGYILQPIIPIQRAPNHEVLGELDGVYVISGYDNAAENTTTVNGNTAVIFQNAYRTTPHEFWALELK